MWIGSNLYIVPTPERVGTMWLNLRRSGFTTPTRRFEDSSDHKTWVTGLQTPSRFGGIRQTLFNVESSRYSTLHRQSRQKRIGFTQRVSAGWGFGVWIVFSEYKNMFLYLCRSGFTTLTETFEDRSDYKTWVTGLQPRHASGENATTASVCMYYPFGNIWEQ